MINKHLRAGMREATRLTRAGRLLEATAAIQRTLQGGRAATHERSPSDPAAGEVVEGIYRVDAPTATRLLPLLPAPAEPATAPASSGKLPQEPAHPNKTRAAGGQFLAGSYANAAGSRSYKLFVPSGYHGQALPLIVMLHGCTQTPDDFAAGTRMNILAEEQGFFVAYPAQARSANGSMCWNWFKLADQQRDQGEPSLIAGITRQIGHTYHVDSRRVYVAGLSSGGAMAVIMGMTYPDLYAAIGSHSGLAYAVAQDLPSALAAMRRGAAAPNLQRTSPVAPGSRAIPAIVFHGDRDTTVHPRNADQVVAQWAALYASESSAARERKPRVSVQPGHAPDGQAYTRAMYHDEQGQVMVERWQIHNAGHAWSGGSRNGSFTDPNGPDATREMLRFFLAHPR